MGRIRVLIADDNGDFRQRLRMMISDEDDLECVGEAADGEDVIEMTKSLLPDLVLLDMEMPRVDGIGAAKYIKSFYPNIGILVVSAYRYRHYLLACINVGVDGFMLKNSSRKQIIEAINKVYRKEPAFDLQITSEIVPPIHSIYGVKNENSSSLTNREFQILRFAAAGMNDDQIADEIGTSTEEVGSHFNRTQKKLNTKSRKETIVSGLKWVLSCG